MPAMAGHIHNHTPDTDCWLLLLFTACCCLMRMDKKWSIMYFPVGWPKQLQINGHSALVHIAASQTRLLCTVLTKDSVTIWNTKVGYVELFDLCSKSTACHSMSAESCFRSACGFSCQLLLCHGGTFFSLVYLFYTHFVLTVFFCFIQPAVRIVAFQRSQNSVSEFGANQVAQWKPDSSMLAVTVSNLSLSYYKGSVISVH